MKSRSIIEYLEVIKSGHLVDRLIIRYRDLRDIDLLNIFIEVLSKDNCQKGIFTLNKVTFG